MSFNQPSLLMIISSMISLFLSVYAWKRRPDILGKFLSMILAATTIWSFFYGFEVASTNQMQIMIFGSLDYIGIVSVPVIWLIFAALYCGKDGWINTLNISLLFIVPVISCIMFATNNWHHLFYSSVELNMMDGYSFQKYVAGPFWWVHLVYSYMATILGLFFFFQLFFKVDHTHRLHVGLFLAGSILPFVVNIAYVAGLKPYGFLDLTPVAFIMMGAIFVFGVFAINLFDINPIVLDLLFNNIPDATFVLDSNKRIINTNPAAQTLINSSQSNWDDQLKSNSSLFETFLSSNIDANEIEFNNKSYQKSNTVIRGSKGKSLGTLIVLHDITEQKLAEAQLIENESHLRELNATKDKFFSIIAHDLRNPISSVMGLTGMMADNKYNLSLEEHQEFSYSIHQSIQSTYQLLENLLDWSRLQRGMIPFDPQRFNLKELIGTCDDSTMQIAHKKSISLVIDIPEGLEITADQNMLKSILRNMVTNAIKFTREGGKVEVKASEMENGTVLFTIADTGLGMKRELIDQLFRIDTQVSRPGTNNEPSTGLGLILCKEFVEKQEGKIWVESEVGKGSTFCFTIPDEH